MHRGHENLDWLTLILDFEVFIVEICWTFSLKICVFKFKNLILGQETFLKIYYVVLCSSSRSNFQQKQQQNCSMEFKRKNLCSNQNQLTRFCWRTAIFRAVEQYENDQKPHINGNYWLFTVKAFGPIFFCTDPRSRNWFDQHLLRFESSQTVYDIWHLLKLTFCLVDDGIAVRWDIRHDQWYKWGRCTRTNFFARFGGFKREEKRICTRACKTWHILYILEQQPFYKW